MGALKDRLAADLTAAMKGRDELVTATLRMALTAVRTEEVAGKAARELSDDEVLAVLGREAKKRREAAEAFHGAGRDALGERERAEGEVLARYLPVGLTDEELAEAVGGALAGAGLSGPKDMGAAMKAARAAVGARADGGRIAAEVRRRLGAG